ncbi:MFS transporter [Nonomuraea sp. NPDC050556]|uniref:MFS transporter n=1 Tax=Nonomuraea sp. NPDC050556 TaxID=3364369 RepID=UPI0037AEA5FF
MIIRRPLLVFLTASMAGALAWELYKPNRLGRESGLPMGSGNLAWDVGWWLAPLSALAIGVLADRIRRRTLLVAGNLVGAGLLGLLAVSWWQDLITLPQVFAVTLAISLLADVSCVGEEALLPTLVSRRRLVLANTLLYVSVAVVGVAEELLDGLPIPFLLLAGALAYVIAARGFARSEEEPPAPALGVGRSLVDGFRFAARHRVVRALTLSLMATTFFGSFVNSVEAASAIGSFAPYETVKALWLGQLGGVIGVLLVVPLATRYGAFTTAWVSLLVTLPLGMLLPLVLLTVSSAGLVTQFMVAFAQSAGLAISSIALLSLRQEVTPSHLLGRAAAVVYAATSLAAIASDALCDALGPEQMLWVGMFGLPLAVLPLLAVRRHFGAGVVLSS